MNDAQHSLRRVLPAALLALWLVLVLLPGAGQAQDATATATATATTAPAEVTPTTPADDNLNITSVQPGTVVNTGNTEIVVTGSGFVDGAVVVLSNWGGLETTFVSRQVLRANVPAGVPPGSYDVQVVKPNAATAVLRGALAVVLPAGPTDTPEPSPTPAPTDFVRPLLVVQSYGASAPQIAPGQNLDFEMTIVNAGQAVAGNVLATFVSGDFVPRATGGVRALGTLAPGQTIRFWQPLFATDDLRGRDQAVLKVTATYTDINGQSYESSFELTFPVVPQASGGAAATATPTATPTGTPGPRQRPQLLVTGYATDPEQLQPGVPFALTMNVSNEGEANARNVTLIVGGGSAGSGSADGTPEAGGVSGAGGSFTEFAPIGSSNVSRLGNLRAGDGLDVTQQLIVNTTTKPGAYPVKVSFVYTDDTGVSFTDDQVITLLVFQQPQVEMNFYTAPPALFAGETGGLPLQLVNSGRTSVVFGNFSVSAENADLSNNAIFVGALEPGGFFPLDAMITPFEPGPLDLELSVTYTDDFNRPAVITDTLTVEVLEGAPVEPEGPVLGPDGLPIDDGQAPVDDGSGGGQESLGQRIWRFIRGLLGLGSEPAGVDQPTFEDQAPLDGYEEPIVP